MWSSNVKQLMMSAMSLAAALALPAVGVATFSMTPAASAAEAPAASSGTVKGVVTGKKERGFLLKADGKTEADFYTPRWIGGMPSDGGGLSKEIVAAIKDLQIGDRVQMTWLKDERLRVTSLQILERANGESRREGDHGAENKPEKSDKQTTSERNGDTEYASMKPKKEATPETKTGTITGRVMGKFDKGVLVRARGTDEAKFYAPRWVGGMPSDGGGLDPKMVNRLATLHVGDTVTIDWDWKERRRIINLEVNDRVESGEYRTAE